MSASPDASVEYHQLNIKICDFFPLGAFGCFLTALKSKKTLTNDLLKCDKFNILDKMYETVFDEETDYVSNYVMQCFKF